MNLYANAGGFAGFLLSAKSVSGGSSYIYADETGQQPVSPSAQSFDSTDDIKSSIHKFNAGVIGAIGLSYQFHFGKIFIEGGGNYGFINIQKYKADGTNYSGAATIHLGYLHALHNKKSIIIINYSTDYTDFKNENYKFSQINQLKILWQNH